MTMRDFEAEEAELDREIAAMNAAPEEAAPPEDEAAAAAPLDSGETVDDTEREAFAGTADSDAEAPDTAETPQESDEKRVRDAQAKMHEALQERAELRRVLADVLRQNEALQARLDEQAQAAPKAPQPKAPSQRPGLERFREELPEIAEPFEQTVDSFDRDIGDLKSELAEIKAERQAVAYWGAIRARHPDLDALNQDAKFWQWHAGQSPVLQRFVNSASADEVIALLDIYKAQRGAPKAPPAEAASQTRLAQARSVAAPRVGRAGAGVSQSVPLSDAQVDNLDPRTMSDDDDARLDAYLQTQAQRRAGRS